MYYGKERKYNKIPMESIKSSHRTKGSKKTKFAKGYEKKPETLQQAAYFMNLFEKSIRDAKRQSNKGFDGTRYNIQQHDF